jgi:hypothetical protein
MAEDSGAFKTNPRDSARFRHFVMTRQRVASKPHRIKKSFPGLPSAFAPPICNKRHRYLAVFLNQPDSRRAGGARRVANTVNSVVTRVPDSSKAFAYPFEGGTCFSMLPSFRFLFAAVVLSMSILVFGLGVAALLRTAHEEFASNPFWHTAPETTFPQQSEPKGPVLALLRVDPLPAEQEAPDDVRSVAAMVEPAAIVSVPAEPENIAALSSEEVSPQENAKPEIPAAESPAQSETAPAQAEAAAGETQIAASEQASSPANEAAPAASEQTSAPDSPQAFAASVNIAALDAPTAAVEAKPASAKPIRGEPDESIIKKRQQARRAAQRRSVAARARLARQAAQQAANPFAQPFAQPAAAQSR